MRGRDSTVGGRGLEVDDDLAVHVPAGLKLDRGADLLDQEACRDGRRFRTSGPPNESSRTALLAVADVLTPGSCMLSCLLRRRMKGAKADYAPFTTGTLTQPERDPFWQSRRL